MFRLFSRDRSPVPVANRFRARLRLEGLEGRDQPSSLVDGDAFPEPPLNPPLLANVPPKIVDFTAEEVSNGLFIITGRVIDEAPGGLTVTFAAGVEAVHGKTVKTDANGYFSLTVQLRTNGTESGTVGATTVDAQGAVSNEPLLHLSPTPAP